MKVVTAQQMRELDRRAMDEAGIPGSVLMENAGQAVVDVAIRRYGPLCGKRTAVFCGAGNNGGDGYVIVRLLNLAGAVVSVFESETKADPARQKPDAAIHRNVALRGGGFATEALPSEDTLSSKARLWSDRFDLAFDALLGTGVKSAPRDWYAHAIRAINALSCPVIAVDLPSGVDSDTGATPGEAVRAAHTVTFAYPKLGLFLFPGAERAGRIHVSDIEFPWKSLPSGSSVSLVGCGPRGLTSGLTCSQSLREPDGWEDLVQKRRPESNKGDYGHVGILAGSRRMAGAPALTARAAQRSGAGLVTVLSAASAQSVLAMKLDEQMTLPLPETDGAVAESAWDAVREFAAKATVLCMGPGLTTQPEVVRLIHRILREIDVAVILDADGLNALASNPEVATQRTSATRKPFVLTPHPGEAARLLGTSIDAVQSDRVGAVRELAGRYHAVAVLKGRHTLIADPQGAVCINTSGNPGMATGGMGDALTGVIGATLAQNIARSTRSNEVATPTLNTAALGVHLHGLAGDIAASERGEIGLTAGDVIERLPMAIARLIGKAEGEI